MPNFSAPVEPTFIALSIGAVLVLVGIGILLVKMGKKTKNI